MDEEDEVESPAYNYISRDYSHDFTTMQVFESREELLTWILAVAQANGFVTVITRLMKQRGQNASKLFVGCERSGRPRIGKDGGVKKCNCPFKLQGLNEEGTDRWKLEVCHGMHNHEMTEHFEGKEFSGSLTRMQFLLEKLHDNHYVVFRRGEEAENRLIDILWAHPTALRLVKNFPWVLVMNCSRYRTNRYMFPLLFECVGVTSTLKTFSVAHAFICSERQDSLEWVVNHIRSFLPDDQLPKCIVTDRDIALMNAVKKLFPTSAHLLCTLHINKNISGNCKKYFPSEEGWQAFFSVWKQVLYSHTIPEYFNAVAQLTTQYGDYKEVLEYLQGTWLIPHHHQFIKAWTDHVFHLGNTTTQRVGSFHALMKKYIENCRVDLVVAWKDIHEAIMTQHTKIWVSFERSKMIRRHVFAAERLYDLINNKVSQQALEKTHKHKALAELDLRQDEMETFCRPCPIIAKKGLPCRHMIAKWITQDIPIPLKSIHPYWRCLSGRAPVVN